MPDIQSADKSHGGLRVKNLPPPPPGLAAAGSSLVISMLLLLLLLLFIMKLTLCTFVSLCCLSSCFFSHFDGFFWGTFGLWGDDDDDRVEPAAVTPKTRLSSADFVALVILLHFQLVTLNAVLRKVFIVVNENEGLHWKVASANEMKQMTGKTRFYYCFIQIENDDERRRWKMHFLFVFLYLLKFYFFWIRILF